MIRVAFSLFLFLTAGKIFSQNIDHIAPPDWYVGMRDSSLQLMIHGDDIATFSLQVEYPGVRLQGTQTVENPNYVFVDLVIEKNAKPGNLKLKFKNGKQSFEHLYTLKQRTARDFAYGLDASDFIYLLMPDRFSNGDTSNDIVQGMHENTVDRNNPKGRHGGDLAGIIQHLDHIRALGATAVWCTPLIENNQPKYSYHGYAATDHYTIDPRYGTNADYAQFVQEAHKKELKVVVDLVHNHIGNMHWTFLDLPMSGWVHRLDTGFVRSNYRTSVKHDPYGSEFDFRKMNEGWFDKHMPDLNQDNPFLAKYIIQNNIWWIETFHVDGFRLDTYPYSDLAFLQQWALAIEKEYPGFGIFGEVWVNGVGIQGYFHGNNHLQTGYNSQLPGLTDFTLYDAVITGLNEGFGWQQGVARVYHTLTQDYLYGDVMQNVLFLSNHDVSRIYSVLGEDLQKFKLSVALVLTMRGMVQWYYGDEILMKNFTYPEDGLVREDFPGGWPADTQNKYNGNDLQGNVAEAYQYVRTLANWRRNSDAIAHGKTMQFIPENGVYVYFRYTERETVMVVINTSENEYTPDPVRLKERLQGFTSAMDVLTGQTEIFESVHVPERSAGVFVLK